MEGIRKVTLRFYEGCTVCKTVLVLVVLLLYFILTAYSGGAVFEILLFWVVVAVYIVLPGLLAAKVLKTEQWFSGFTGPLAILLGAGFFAVLYCFSMRLHLLALLRVVPPLLSAGCLLWFAWEAKKKWVAKKPLRRPVLLPEQWMLVLLFAALLLLYTFTGVVKNALPLAVGDTLLDHDLLWNVGNANSFQLAFPPVDIRYFDVRLSYHYLTELLAGALSLVSGVDAYRVIGFYLQPLMLGAMILCLYRLARLFWPKSTLKTLLFPYAFFLFSCASLWKVLPNGWSVFWNQNIVHLITNINSQTTAYTVLSIFLGLFVSAARQKYRVGIVHFLLTLCAFVLLCVAKGPMAAIVAAALVLTLLVGLFFKQTTWRGLLLGAALGAVFVLFYFVLFSSGANSSTRFSVDGTLLVGYFANLLTRFQLTNHTLWMLSIPLFYLVQTLLLMPAQVPLFVRGLVSDVRHFGRLQPERMLYYAAGIGGVLAYFLVYHPHMSQNYFLYTGIFFFTALAVGNLDTLRPVKLNAPWAKRTAHKLFVLIVAFFALVAFVTTAFLYTNLLGSGARRLATNLGFLEKYPYEVVMSPDDQAGMEWLREQGDETAMFATNRIHTGARMEGISNLYSGLSGRQGYMEGFQYAVTNMGVPEASVQERLAVNQALFSAETPPEEVLRLCRQWGIDYLVYSTQMEGEESQLSALELVFDSPTLRIYQVP
ncbi:hypothetical protein LJC49_05990 [Ruminococcaceae bacterium OttesenSCG-928-I18]|nr:hypothetical protein [Ruminococcaceae bacterium OttesenSCG-928-I18]